MMHLRNIISFIILLVISINSVNADNLQRQIQKTIHDYLENNFLNATFMFADNNKVINAGASGVSSLDEGIQLRVNEQMLITTITQSMTATAILRLQDLKMLDVRDKVGKYLGVNSAIWHNGVMPEWANQITIHHLLTHSSGLPEYLNILPLDTSLSLAQIIKSIINFAAARPLLFKPGTKYHHANTNFVILGVIIEQVSNKNLAQFLYDEFFKPHKLTSTYLPSLQTLSQMQMEESDFPIMYLATFTDGKPILSAIKSDIIFLPYADNGIISNTKDIISWNKALHQRQLLSESSYKMMTTKYFPVKNSERRNSYVGYGLFISEFEPGEQMYHYSIDAQSISEAGYLPKQGIYFAILSNVFTILPSTSMNTKPEKLTDRLSIYYFCDAILNTIKLHAQ